jgi:NADPH-dependent glutamate synthase beta subunit-like oxidoreductase
MPAYDFEVEEAESEGVEFEWLAAPAEIAGDGRVQRLRCNRMRLGEPGADGRRRPEVVEGADFWLPAHTVVAAIGQRPRMEIAEWFDGLELAHGELVVEPATGRTGNPLVFAGGDAVSGGASVVQAVAEGKRAARAIEEAVLCAS